MRLAAIGLYTAHPAAAATSRSYVGSREKDEESRRMRADGKVVGVTGLDWEMHDDNTQTRQVERKAACAVVSCSGDEAKCGARGMDVRESGGEIC